MPCGTSELDNREAAIVAAQARERTNREIRERLAREAHERDMTSLRIKVAQGEGWRVNVENAARNTVAQQYRQTLMGELDAMINPPQPSSKPSRKLSSFLMKARQTLALLISIRRLG
jgi:hypothetical protein